MGIKRIAAYILLISVYGVTYLMALIGRILPHRRWKPGGRIIVTGTFHNPNWYLSHITPLARSGIKELILIVDEPQIPMERVRFVCPPKWLAKLLSRAGAKAIWMFLAGLRYKPDLYMGYHLAPGACSALIAGKILGRPSCYQMTGGPVEIIGGGIDAIESVGGALGHPSKLIEAMAVKVARQFDLIVVRGNKAKEFFAGKNIKDTVAVITGSVNGRLQPKHENRINHLIFVGRLCPIKQVNQFIEIVAEIARVTPDIRAVVIGDGPLLSDMKKYADKLELSSNIEFLGNKKDIGEILANSKIFILSSITEGLSIAMAEAMAAGVVPIVADVGELGELVIDGVNGYLIEPNNIGDYTQKSLFLLQNNALWTQFSRKAIEAAGKHCDIEVITKKWERNIQDVISLTSGHFVQEAPN
jgi:glycosyltransferase involved in cell wall biosynthesis